MSKVNYSHVQVGPLENLSQRSFKGMTGKQFVGHELGLTGCEVSLNRMPTGTGMPFTHAHKRHEELYIVLRGSGTFYLDGEEFPIAEGSLIRVAPIAARAIAAESADLYFICIQTEENSLTQSTTEDGYKLEQRASWMNS